MRNKGFFWFLTILLSAVCLYQLSFTYITIGVEEDAAREAAILAEEAKTAASKNGGIFVTTAGDTIDFNKPEAMELAKAAFTNEVLKAKADKSVYPVLGTKFKDVKARSLAFGLDLVGGMSVTLEISVPDLIKSYAQNPNDLNFKIPLDNAVARHARQGGDFVTIFVDEYERRSPGKLLVRQLNISELKELSITSSNNDVAKFFQDKVASSMDGVEQIMSKRINQFGVAQPNIQKESSKNRLYIELPGVQDEVTVAKKLQSTANLEFFETYQLEEIQGKLAELNNMSRVDEVVVEDDSALYADTTADSSNVAVNDTANKVGDSTKKPALPKAKIGAKGLLDYMKPVGGWIIGEVAPENKDEVNAILRRADIQRSLTSPGERVEFMWSANPEKNAAKQEVYFVYAVRIPENGKALVGGSDVKFATQSFDQQSMQNTVDVTMSIDGAERWARMTEKNVGRAIAITMDKVVYSAPVVQNAITGGNTQISGNFTIESAKDLAGLLNGGALPAPCVIKEQTKVGPTIGAENSKAGLVSFAFAFLAVFIYMYFFYGKAGLAANIALLANVIFIFGCLASFGAVLTLAGIAGIVLTIGTAVDANILIFERVKEEIAHGKSVNDAVSIGNIKALPSIIDANVTHLLVAIILKVFGTGEIESFATTLIVGIFTSVFSAIIIAKLIISTQLEKGKNVSFSTGTTANWFKNFHFDWIGKRKYFYMFSIAVTILGIGSLFVRKLSPSVEFTGGRTFGVIIEKPADVDQIEEGLAKFFTEPGKTEPASVEVKTKANSYNLEITTNYLLKNDTATSLVKQKLQEGLTAMNAKVGSYKITNTRSISASVSSEMWSSAVLSISLSLLVIFAYIFIRFGQWQYSLGAILGLAHDVLFVLSVFSLLHGILPFNMDVNQAFIAAVLTVIGYSMNDTVIVFDRIRESLNFNHGREDSKVVINDALNKTLSRTFNTSMILFVVLLVMFIFGGPAIKGFLFALLVGVVIGTYSSLCVATPVLVDFTKKFKVKD